MESPDACLISVLPSDVLGLVLRLLPPRDLLRLAQVSRRFREAASSDSLWRPILEHIGEHFLVHEALWTRGQDEKPGKLVFKDLCRRKVVFPYDIDKKPVSVKWVVQDGRVRVPQPVKIVVVGDGACGKTSLLMSYIYNSFPRDNVPTVFENLDAYAEHRGQFFKLELWDTFDGAENHRLRALSYPGTHVFLCCFNLVSQTSFRNVTARWLREIRQYSHQYPGYRTILVGNKLDLRSDEDTLQRLAKLDLSAVSSEEAIALAKAEGFDAYVETSALELVCLKGCIQTAVDAFLSAPGYPEQKVPEHAPREKCRLM